MKRDPKKLACSKYDILVIGGGIYGVSIAWDATQRGLRVALIDKGDFAGATSSNSLKTIHGGLRYLQHLDFKRMRESIRERTALMKIAPHLVHPIPVMMPTCGHAFRSRTVFSLALLANDVISFDRNRPSDPQKCLPRGHIISKEEVGKILPEYDMKHISGGALWYDCQCVNTERMAMAYVTTAVEHGADAANYVECTGFLGDPDKIRGITARDSITGEFFDISADIVINTAGPWIDRVLNKVTHHASYKQFNPSSAMNIIVRRKLLERHAVGLAAPFEYRRRDGSVYRGSRILFFVPWRGFTIIGTDHRPYDGDPDDFKVDELQITNFLDSVNRAYPAAAIKRDEIAFVHAGLLPMTGINHRTGKVNLLHQYKILDHHAEDNIEGLISVIGVKYTTHRDVSQKVTDLVFKKLGRPVPKCFTDEIPLAGGDIEKFDEYLSSAIREHGYEKRIIRHLVYTYGTKFKDILQYGEISPDLLRNITDSDEVIKAEVVHAVRNEMAVKLTDVVMRRTDLGSAQLPGEGALEEVAWMMARELDWNDDMILREINETKMYYDCEINAQLQFALNQNGQLNT
jgi:glycerol-3-phosphate dehydrogenase